MHVLELSEAEWRVVRDAVRARAREMEEELVRTDDRAFRHGLREDLEAVEALSRRLGERESQPPGRTG